MNNFFLSCKECILEGPRSFYGCFYLGPFNSSQSLTVANALRRTLLSEISGLGIIAVEIEGVKHEYSNFSGIRESILDLLLNLKEIVLYSNLESKDAKSFEPFAFKGKKCFYGYLQVTGPGIIRASDLKLPYGLFSVDPYQYIATLAENGKLNLKFLIGKSKSSYSILIEKFDNKNVENYFYTNEFFLANNKSGSDPLKTKFLKLSTTQKGVGGRKPFDASKISNQVAGAPAVGVGKIFKLDPVFTPIKKVNYNIEPYGTLPIDENNQILSVELWTNGSIHPRNAMYEALNFLNTLFSNLEKMKILNDIYTKSIDKKSDENYFKGVKKTSSFLCIERTKINEIFFNTNKIGSSKRKNIVGNFSPNAYSDTDSCSGEFEIKNKNFALNLKQYQKLKEKENLSSNINTHSSSIDFFKLNKYTTLSVCEGDAYRTFETLQKIYLKKKEEKIINKSTSIKIFHFPFRIENSLIQTNILTINDLFNKNRTDLLKISGIGKQSVYFIEKKITLFFNTIF